MLPVQENSVMSAPRGFGVYIHWPFCKAKCPYCDFNSHVAKTVDHDLWAERLKQELLSYADTAGHNTVTSIFFGGGTPSLMEPRTVERLVSAVYKNWRVDKEIEITLEANPTSVEAEKLTAFKSAGVNRLSIGVQSFVPEDLTFLGREHSATEAMQAIETAASLYDRFSFDMMYARPNQTVEGWMRELETAMRFAVGHISLYQLTIEPGTQFFTRYKRGDFKMPDEALAAEFYELTCAYLGQNGFNHYEVSNFARPGQESQHNLIYWRYGDYLGIGPGAHGRVTVNGQKFATQTHRAPDIWLERVGRDGNARTAMDALSGRERVMEQVMMGLRLEQGVLLSAISDETGLMLHDCFSAQALQTLMDSGDAVITATSFKLTTQGRMRLNGVLNFLFDRILI